MKFYQLATVILILLSSCSEISSDNDRPKKATNEGRAEYELERLKDPATGEVPENIRMRELAFASNLPKVFTKTSRASVQIFEPIGPRNVGGRTRAVSYDIEIPNVILAGGVSGGMWRSADNGVTWNRATNYEDHSAVSCVIQDIRVGKTNVFYYGSGESIGNSASKAGSAFYQGSGMYKSTDHGATWAHISSTSAAPNKASDWSIIYNVATDPSVTDKDVIYAATRKGIRRSENGGLSWTLVLGGNLSASFTNIVVTPTGEHYATISDDGSNAGFWRSTDGINWTNISPNDLPSSHDKTLIAFAPSNTKVVYFYSATNGSGLSDVSFWKYTYVSGNGSGNGGVWQNRSSKLPPSKGYDLETQGSYCMSIAVKPNNENFVLIGGTDLFKSADGFNTNNQIKRIGGYGADGYFSWDMYRDNQHADQQSLAFNPHNNEELLAGTDGGLHFTSNINLSKVIWASYNNGYQTTQFYGLGIDHTDENEIVISGYQDNGSWWTNGANMNTDWKYTQGGDGSYCAKEGGTNKYYFSAQNAWIWRMSVSSTGSTSGRKRVNPTSLGFVEDNFLFNHPYILDPANNNKMYLPYQNTLWRNSNLSALDNNQYNWTEIATLPTSSNITAITASTSSPGTVFVGTSSRKIYKIVDSGSASATITEISGGITNGSYTSNIAVDPNDVDKILAVYSNYNVISIWYTDDGGSSWTNVEGNLKGDTDPGVPPSLDYIGNGPSMRWARFIPTSNGNAILLGTSIGLFATNDLDAAEVEWVQQASDVIGNVVIEQIDSRDSDGFCVVGTHGAGAYKTYFNNNDDITSVENVTVDKLSLLVYPNPVVNEVNIDFELSSNAPITLNVMNSSGQVVRTQTIQGNSGNNHQLMNLSDLSNGMYYVTIYSEEGNFTKAIVKQ